MRRRPSYRLHKASGNAIVTIAGKMHYLGPYGSEESRARYDELIGEHKANSSDPTTTTSTTVSQLCLAYLRYCKAFYAVDGNPTAEVCAVKGMLKRFRKRYGELLTCHIRPKHLEAVIEHMANKGLSRTYCNQGLGRLKRMFRWGCRKDLVPGGTMFAIDQAAGLSAGRSNAREPKVVEPVDDTIVDATLPHVPAIVADLINLLRWTGARPSELFGMRRGEVDRSNETWKYVPRRHKTQAKGKSRVIVFGPKSREVLLRYLVGPADDWVFEKPDTGGPFARWNFHQYIDKGAKAAGVAHWFPYQLRHAAGTTARKEADLDAAQALLGHARRATTERYAKLEAGRAAVIVERIG